MVRVDLGSLADLKAASPLTVDAELASRTPAEALLPVLGLAGAAWTAVGVDGILVEVMSAALTNQVFSVTRTGGDEGAAAGPRVLLVRLYGRGGDQGMDFLSREEEVRLFAALSSAGVGPRLVGLFANGRLEEFLEGAALRAGDIHDPATSARIARAVAGVHAIEIAGEGAPGEEAVLWGVLARWTSEGLARARSLLAAGRGGGGLGGAPAALLEELASQLPAVRERLESSCPPPALRLAFCHNDLQYGNIMEVAGKGIVLIDYEYAGRNPVGFDLANHFCEHMADYHAAEPHRLDPAKYPPPARRRAFAEEYLRALAQAGGAGEGSVRPEEVEGLAEGAHLFTGASHIFWASWGAIKAAEGAEGFDYWGYAQQRADLFRAWRAGEAGGGAR